MEWQKLDLAKASLLKKEVDTVLARLNELITNPGDVDKAALINTIQSRIQELENFYLKNSDDERAILFEKERLRLRKALQPFYTSSSSKDTRSMSASEIYESTMSRGAQDRLSVSQLSKSSRQLVSSNKSNHSLHSLLANPPPKSPANQAANRSLRSPNSQAKIYAWEDREGKPPRSSFEVCGAVFDPSSQSGFYSRRLAREEMEDFYSDKFIDMQIILTQEELTTLAARIKVDRQDVKLLKNQAASTSVHTSVPYIDPTRIKQDMLRPGHPDRWLGMQSFAH